MMAADGKQPRDYYEAGITRSDSSKTRESVARLRAEGLSYRVIGQRLGITKSTVAYHARRLGVPADDRCARRHDWREIQQAVDAGLSKSACEERFGFCSATWSKAVKRGAIVPREWVIPIDELLVTGRKRSRGHLKSRLIREGLKENRCEECGITEWRGKPLSMELHHVNGDGQDNRLENLQLLCGNCHAQTDNWGGRGKRRERRRQAC